MIGCCDDPCGDVKDLPRGQPIDFAYVIHGMDIGVWGQKWMEDGAAPTPLKMGR